MTANKTLNTVYDLLKHFQIHDWDALLIGDGSGQGWNNAVGWAVTLYDRASGQAKPFWGAVNSGTISFGEIFPYAYALTWYMDKNHPGARRRRANLQHGHPVYVHIFTDSEYVANCGNRKAQRHALRELWEMFDAFERNGVKLQFHHVHRDLICVNILADQISRRVRIDLQDTVQQSYERALQDLQKKYPGLPDNASPYDFLGVCPPLLAEN